MKRFGRVSAEEKILVSAFGKASLLFKFRSKVGLDVAVEALRKAGRRRKIPVDELMEQARVCRLANVIRPCLEALS